MSAGLSASLLTTLFTVPVLRVVSAARRHTEVQVPLVTDAASYQAVAGRIVSLQEAHGHPVRREPAPWWLTVPLRILRAVGHDAFASPIPADLPNKCCVAGVTLETIYVTTGGGQLLRAAMTS